MQIKNTNIKIIKGDITGLKVDAVVNSANIHLKMESGLAGVIKKKAGMRKQSLYILNHYPFLY